MRARHAFGLRYGMVDAKGISRSAARSYGVGRSCEQARSDSALAGAREKNCTQSLTVSGCSSTEVIAPW